MRGALAFLLRFENAASICSRSLRSDGDIDRTHTFIGQSRAVSLRILVIQSASRKRMLRTCRRLDSSPDQRAIADLGSHTGSLEQEI